MIIECPKCGFTQPKDRYCARCGVDIENFQIQPPPLFVRLLNSPSLYVGFFIFSLLVLGLFIATQPNSQIAKTAKNWVLAIESDSETESLKTLMKETHSEQTEETSEHWVASEESSNEKIILPPPETSKVADEKKTIEYLSVEFVEFPRLQLEELYNQGKILAETNDMQVILYDKKAGWDSLQELDSQAVLLPGKNQQKISENRNLLINHFTPQDRGEDQGFSLQISLKSFNANNLSLEYDLFYNLKVGENNENMSNSLSGSYQFSPQSTLILSGILPRQRLDENLSEDFQSSPLSVMSSENFVSPDAESSSEFLILISVK